VAEVKTVPIENIVSSLLKNFKFYKEAVVIDYIENPAFATEEQVVQYGLNFTLDMVRRSPRGTVVGYPTDSPSTRILFYPFFSNHVFLPVKPGEFVWYFEYGRIPYWISRRVADFGYEDVNYTMASNANSPKSISAVDSPKAAFTGPPPDLSASQTQSSGKKSDLTLSMLPGDLTFDQIRSAAIASKDIVYEPVPVYSAKCSELVIQGSNNTSIVQGNNFGGGANQTAGYVDISAGRGRTSTTAVNTVDTPPVASRENLNPGEGESSISTDAARIIVSHGIDADTVFSTGLPGGTVSPQFSPAVVSKADKIRVIARSDVAVSVEGSNGCSVVLNSNGDIYVNPSASGKVYLSGPASDQPYLRYDDLNAIVNDFLDIAANLQNSIGPSAIAASEAAPKIKITAEAAATQSGLVPGTTLFDLAVKAAVEEGLEPVVNDVNVTRFGNIGLAAEDILRKIQTIKSQKILGS
jgi:hypothetical protein